MQLPIDIFQFSGINFVITWFKYVHIKQTTNIWYIREDLRRICCFDLTCNTSVLTTMKQLQQLLLRFIPRWFYVKNFYEKTFSLQMLAKCRRYLWMQLTFQSLYLTIFLFFLLEKFLFLLIVNLYQSVRPLFQIKVSSRCWVLSIVILITSVIFFKNANFW